MNGNDDSAGIIGGGLMTIEQQWRETYESDPARLQVQLTRWIWTWMLSQTAPQCAYVPTRRLTTNRACRTVYTITFRTLNDWGPEHDATLYLWSPSRLDVIFTNGRATVSFDSVPAFMTWCDETINATYGRRGAGPYGLED